jgi:hypothetical protein
MSWNGIKYLIEMKVLDMYNQTHTESTTIIVRTQAVAAPVNPHLRTRVGNL